MMLMRVKDGLRDISGRDSPGSPATLKLEDWPMMLQWLVSDYLQHGDRAIAFGEQVCADRDWL